MCKSIDTNLVRNPSGEPITLNKDTAIKAMADFIRAGKVTIPAYNPNDYFRQRHEALFGFKTFESDNLTPKGFSA
jgi:hypothetical protein